MSITLSTSKITRQLFVFKQETAWQQALQPSLKSLEPQWYMQPETTRNLHKVNAAAVETAAGKVSGSSTFMLLFYSTLY